MQSWVNVLQSLKEQLVYMYSSGDMQNILSQSSLAVSTRNSTLSFLFLLFLFFRSLQTSPVMMVEVRVPQLVQIVGVVQQDLAQ